MPEPMLLGNFSLPSVTSAEIVTTTSTSLSTEGQIVIAVFAIIVIAYIIISAEKEKYTHWKNPKGKEVNLVRLMRIILWGYTGIVIIAFLVQRFILGG